MDVPRMYNDEQRDGIPRECWDIARWVDYVETGRNQAERNERFTKAPRSLRSDIRADVIHRHARRRRG